MSAGSFPLGKPIRPEPEKVDPDAYKPIPGRPGWFINGKGQLMRKADVQEVSYYFGVPIPVPRKPP